MILKGHKESNWTNKRVKIGPKKGKNVSIDLEAMPLFHLIKSLGLEHCLFIKFPNFALGESKVANWGQKGSKLNLKGKNCRLSLWLLHRLLLGVLRRLMRCCLG